MTYGEMAEQAEKAFANRLRVADLAARLVGIVDPLRQELRANPELGGRRHLSLALVATGVALARESGVPIHLVLNFALSTHTALEKQERPTGPAS